MGRHVLAIGMDAADPTLIESWMEEGHLPNLRRLHCQGTYAHIESLPTHKSELAWTTFLTGCRPEKTGFWSPIEYGMKTYTVKERREAYDFAEFPPFYALGDQFSVTIFDVPQSKLSDQVNGFQIFAWGAHAAFAPRQSRPPHLLQELIERHGESSILSNNFAHPLDRSGLIDLHKNLQTNILRRSAICQDLLQRQDWDLFLTVFSEIHTAGHYFWHLSRVDHPLYGMVEIPVGDALLDTYKSVDHEIGEIVKGVSDETYVVIFSAHGMTDGVLGLPSNAFLPELLYRFSFSGKTGLTFKKIDGTWEVHFDQRLDFIHPSLLQKMHKTLYWLPARWYTPSWPKMKAFALPSFSDGYIRINLQGREARGVVPPSEYNALCDEITELLAGLQDARTGQPMVTQVLRTRRTAADDDVKLPDADLIVLWQDRYATDTVISPEFGRIGPVPYTRSGDHRARGFFLAKGPDIAAQSELSTGHTLDLAPTIRALMGAPLLDHFDGKPLLRLPRTDSPERNPGSCG